MEIALANRSSAAPEVISGAFLSPPDPITACISPRGVRMSARFEEATHTIGFAVLLLLMAFVTYRDIVRVF